jgi:hypothetical protein
LSRPGTLDPIVTSIPIFSKILLLASIKPNRPSPGAARRKVSHNDRPSIAAGVCPS